MTSKEIVLDAHFRQGKADAQTLREKAVDGDLTPTEIIDNESAVPEFTFRDYTKISTGSPFQDGGQVFTLLQPYDATVHNSFRPVDVAGRTFWSLCHTKNPLRAKPYVQSHGTSGMYMEGECCTDPSYEDPAQVFVCNTNNTSHPPSAYPQAWDKWEETA